MPRCSERQQEVCYALQSEIFAVLGKIAGFLCSSAKARVERIEDVTKVPRSGATKAQVLIECPVDKTNMKSKPP